MNSTTTSGLINGTTTTGELLGSTTGSKFRNLIDEYLINPGTEGCSTNDRIQTDFAVHDPDGNVQIHVVGWIVCGIAVIFTLAISFYHIFLHLRNFHDSSHQKYIVRILLIVPIYSIDSWLSFRYYWLSVYFDLFRDCYEAFVIYTFFTLTVNFAGGYPEAKEFVSQKRHKLVIPLCCIEVPSNRGLLRVCKRLVLQYVIINPVLAVVSAILQSQELYCPGNWGIRYGYIYGSGIRFVSVTLAMYGLILTYAVLSFRLKEHQPVQKFLSIKFVIFLSFWQSIAVSGLADVGVIHATAYWTTENVSDGVQSVLTIGEMLIAAIWHIKAYPAKGKYDKPGLHTNIPHSLAQVFNPQDIMNDIYESFVPRTITKKNVEMKFMPGSQEDITIDLPSETILHSSGEDPGGDSKYGYDAASLTKNDD